MKRLIASFLFVLSLCIALFAASAYAEDSDFQINKSGVLTKYLGSGGDVVIPDGVTAIGEKASFNCSSLTGVTIPDGVTSIGGGAFYVCTGLTSVTIPGSVTSIGNYAFWNCTGLTGIDVGESNKSYSSIDGNLYNKTQTKLIQYAVGKKDKSFPIPESVTSIGDSAFYGCTGLTSVILPLQKAIKHNHSKKRCFHGR